jgi:hypothetical protein
MKHTTIAILMIAALVAMTGCIGSSDIGSIGQNVIGSNHLTIIDHHMEVGDYGRLYVGGTVRNDGSEMFNHADVKMTVYDRNGAVIGEGVGAVYSTYPGETCDFKGACMGTRNGNAAKYKIEVVHQSWGERDAIETMKMVATATGQMSPVATPTPSSVSGETPDEIIIKYPITANFELYYTNEPSDAHHRLTIELTADGKTEKLCTGPRPVGETGSYMHRSGYVWTLIEHDSDSCKYAVSDDPHGYPIPEDRRKYMTLHKDGTATLENECDKTVQGYWTRAI